MDKVIVDGHEFQKLRKVIDELYEQFATVYQITRILNDQTDIEDEVDREHGCQIMGKLLHREMDELLDTVSELVGFRSLALGKAA